MPTCEDCGNSEFYLTDGLYFCVSCNLQSQEIVEEEMETFLNIASSIGLAQRKEVHGMLEVGRMEATNRMDNEKSIEPIGTFQILQQVLEKQMSFYCQKLEAENIQNFTNWSQKIWDAYETRCKEFADSGERSHKFVSLREFMYNRHPNHFYLLYEFEHYLIRCKRLKQREKKRLNRKRKKAEAELEGAEEETIDEAVGGVDIEGFLSPQGVEDDDCSSTKSVTKEEQMDVAEFLTDEVCVDSGIDDKSFSAQENNSDVSAQKEICDGENWDEKFKLFYSAEEIRIFRKMVDWLSTNFSLRMRTATKTQRTLSRPSPTTCLATLYLAATLAQIPLSDAIFISNMVKNIIENKLLFLDLTQSLPSVVLTKHELTHWIPLDFHHLPKRIRDISFLLYQFLGEPLAVLHTNLNVSSRIRMIEHCCSKALELLNLPISLFSVCASLMNSFYLKYLKWRDCRLDRSSMSANLFRFDVFIFVSVYFIKKIVIDCCVDRRVNRLSQTWTRWAHHTLLNSSKIPPHFYSLGNNSKLHHESNRSKVLTHIYFVNHLRNKNFMAMYNKLGGLPRNTKKKEKMKTLVSNASVGRATSPKEGTVPECEVIESEHAANMEKLATDLEYEPDLRQVNLKLDEKYVLRKFFHHCKKFKVAKDVHRLQWKQSSLELALSEWQFKNWAKQTMPVSEQNSNHENNSDAENIESDVIEGNLKASGKDISKDDQSSSTIVQTFSFKRSNRGLENHLSKITQHFSAHCGDVDDEEDQLECPFDARSGFSLYDELFCIFSACGGDDFRSYLSVFVGTFRESYGSSDEC